MQSPGERLFRWLFHLGLLAGLLALFLALGKSESHLQKGSYATTVSAFKIAARRELPPLGQEDVRKKVDALFAGLPQHGVALGRPGAPVTMRFFADPECPEARQFAVQLLPRLVRRWVRSGRLRIEYLGVPAETIWPAVFKRQQMALLAAGRQGKLWHYLGFFYHYQGPEFTRYADEWFLSRLAIEVPGLDAEEWERDRHGAGLDRRVGEEAEIARVGEVTYTPAFSIGPTGGSLQPLLHFTLTEPLAFEAAFREAMD